jgi:hypothetical protein
MFAKSDYAAYSYNKLYSNSLTFHRAQDDFNTNGLPSSCRLSFILQKISLMLRLGSMRSMPNHPE